MHAIATSIGNAESRSAAEGNVFARECAFFLAVAIGLGVHVAIENPAGSMFFTCISKYLDAFPFLEQVLVQRCAYELETPLDKRLKKPYKVVGTGSWVQKLFKRCTCRSHVEITRRGLSEKDRQRTCFNTCNKCQRQIDFGPVLFVTPDYQFTRPPCRGPLSLPRRGSFPVPVAAHSICNFEGVNASTRLLV